MTDGGSASEEVTLTNPTGLHARPGVKFTKLAKSFDAETEITCRVLPDGEPFDAKSINKVMKAKARQGATLRIEASGPDAKAAAEALAELVRSGFPD